MYVTSQNAVGEFTSPFGSRIELPKGHVTELHVDQGYWLVGHPEVTVTFESEAEEARCVELKRLAEFNPLKGVPQPQHLTPNATLQLDGYATRHPVIVVNPVGLMVENPAGYNFTQPTVNLVLDKEMVRQVFAEFQAAWKDATPDTDGMTDEQLDILTQPEDISSDEAPGPSTKSDGGDLPEGKGRGRGRKSGAVDEDDI